MAQKKRTNNRPKQQKQAIVKATLTLASKDGWQDLDFTVIAKKAKLSVKTIQTHFDDIWDIAIYALSDISTRCEKDVAEYMSPHDWQDNVMEIIMTRFDLAHDQKDAFLSLRKALLRSPDAAQTMIPFFYETMKDMMALANMPEQYQSPLHRMGFGVLYLSLLDAWEKDDSDDGSKTMAVIDKRMNTYVKAMGFLPSCP